MPNVYTEPNVLGAWHRHGVSISTDSDGIRISIRYWLGWPAFIFVLFWNWMNVMFGYRQWTDISNGIIGLKSWDTLHVCELFAVVGLWVLLWLTTGRQVISIDPVRFQIRKEILGIGWSKSFELAEVRHLRAGWSVNPRARGKWNLNQLSGILYFDCQGKVFSFGNELTVQDVLRIEEIIKKEFPQIVFDRG